MWQAGNSVFEVEGLPIHMKQHSITILLALEIMEGKAQFPKKKLHTLQLDAFVHEIGVPL